LHTIGGTSPSPAVPDEGPEGRLASRDRPGSCVVHLRHVSLRLLGLRLLLLALPSRLLYREPIPYHRVADDPENVLESGKARAPGPLEVILQRDCHSAASRVWAQMPPSSLARLLQHPRKNLDTPPPGSLTFFHRNDSATPGSRRGMQVPETTPKGRCGGGALFLPNSPGEGRLRGSSSPAGAGEHPGRSPICFGPSHAERCR
jgi:hypothetical protein